jgi:uncharacterized membrane protein YgcG
VCKINKENKMKKVVFALAILAILSVLVACSKTSGATGTTGNSTALSTEAELLVGTFKLENTDLAVTYDQAKQLLPLWQTLQQLSSSSTAATEEINAVVDQIKSGMTTQQMAKITEMKLTQQDIMSIMSQAGVSPNGASSTTTPMALGGFPSGGGAQGGGGAPGGADGPPAGGPPAGGGGFPAGGDTGMGAGPGGAATTPQAVRPNMSNQVPQPLLNALIQLLQKKIK